MHVFRVIKTTKRFAAHNDVEPQHVDTTVIWEGSSAEELSQQFPLTPDADPLASERSEDGLLCTIYAIQQLATIGGSWLNIGEVRHPVATTEVELA